ncbi:MAG TPA: ester cyclase [Cyclobacteriaceae bacterium]
MTTTTEQNKAIVSRFNYEFIGQGNLKTFKEIVSDDLFNHVAMPGVSTGPDGMEHFILNVLRKGFPDIKVEIQDQVAERDLVTTRKQFTATHLGDVMGIAPSNKRVVIKVIDIIRLRDGKYIEHWGLSNFAEVLAEIAKP